MKILCVGIDAAQTSTIGEASAVDAVESDAAALASRLRERSWDAVVVGPDAFAALADARELCRDNRPTAWLYAGEVADEALFAGFDGVLDRNADSDGVAEALWRALRSRRDSVRWPKSFVERRIVLATRWAAHANDIDEAGFRVTLAEAAEALRVLRRIPQQAVVLHGEGSAVVRMIHAIHAFDASIGVAAVVLSEDDAAAARAAGAVAVQRDPVSPVELASLAERAWLSWCRAQPSAGERLLVRTVGDIGGVLEALRDLESDTMELETAAGASTVDAWARPEVVFVSVQEAKTLDDDVVAVVVGSASENASSSRPTIGEDAAPEVVAGVLRDAEQRARRQRSLAVLSRRLHEVDGRRVELLKQLADAELERDHLATLDGLTETFNRRGTEDALAREIELARRTGGTLAAVFVEVDVEGRLYGRLGLRGGDEVVRRVADRLKRVLRLSDTLGRVGDDAFLLLLPQTRIAEAMLVGERAGAVLHDPPLSVPGLAASGGVGDALCTVGVAELPWETHGLEDALEVMRAAVHRRRASEGGHAGLLEDASDAAAPGALSAAVLEQMIARVLGGDGLTAVAQPIVRVSDEVVVGYEMLVRGREQPYETPQDLLRLARHRGVLGPVDLCCLQTCLDAAATLASHLLVSINLLPTTLLAMSTHDVVARFASIGDARLCLELSEEQFVGDPRELLDRIAALRSAGVRLAIDDVGKGRGTLDSVMLLEPEVVKIDQELITGASRDTRKARLLRRLVTLATSLGCEVVGEGVERREDLDLLRELDVPYAQGFLWSAPTDMGSIPPAAQSASSRESDAGVSDAGASDAGVSDAGVSDAGVSDAGVSDAGASD